MISKEKLQRFYEGMEKNPKLYGYDDDGNLVQKDREGKVVQTLALPVYRFPTFEEYDAMEKKRTEQIAIASKEYNDERIRLRELKANPDTPISQLITQNNKVIEADIKLQKIRFPLRYVAFLPEGSEEIRKMDFNQPNEKRKYPYPIAMMEMRPFSLQDQYVRMGEAPKKPFISVQEAKEQAMKGEAVLLFSEMEKNGYEFLTLSWVVDLEYNGTIYHSAKQAIYAEIAKAFGDQSNLQKIMTTLTPDGIVYTLQDVPGDTDTNEPKWNGEISRLLYDINLMKFKQYPELGQRLLDTQQANLGAYVSNDNQLGIGISIDNIQAKNPMKWTGQNLLGKTLMDIRQQLRNEQQAAIQQQAEAKGSVKPRSFKIKIKPKSVAPQQDVAPAPTEAVNVPPVQEVMPSVIPPSSNINLVAPIPNNANPVASVPRVPRITRASFAPQP